ncbi:MAG: hypothetical protein ABEJ60_08455 [Halodesulfurarchaeum sp.]
MDDTAIDPERTRELGRTIASRSHENLESATVEDVLEFTAAVEAALESDSEPMAADRLLHFWEGYVGAKLGLDDEAVAAGKIDEHVDRGFRADAFGVDIYQALSKTAAAREESDLDLRGWSERLLELTNRHVAHLESHLRE